MTSSFPRTKGIDAKRSATQAKENKAGRDKPQVDRPEASLQRVAVIGRVTQPGGVQSVILSLLKGLNERGIVPDLIWDLPPNADMLAAKGVRMNYQPIHFTVPSRLLDQVPTTLRYVLETGRFSNEQALPQPYDFYYIFTNSFVLTSQAPHLCYLNGPPLLPQLEAVSPGVRGVPFRMLRRVYQVWLKQRFPVYEYHHELQYVINSDYTARLFEEAHGIRLPVVHPPIDLSGRSFTAGDLVQRDTLTFFSRFVDYKRPEMVLQLAEHYPNQQVILMGGVKPANRAYFENLRQQATSGGLSNVTFLDNPSDEQVRAVLAHTRFYVFPAINEHFGMATAEAIGSGAIPFVHDSGGQREIVPDPRLRFTDDQFLTGFSHLIHFPVDELNQIRFQLRDYVNKFSEEAFIEKMLSFDQQIQKRD